MAENLSEKIEAYRQLADALDDIRVLKSFIALMPYAVHLHNIDTMPPPPRFVIVPEQRTGSPPIFYYRPLPK